MSADELLEGYSVYLAGPMTNIAAFNFPLFFAVTEWLRNVQEWGVRSPAEKDLEKIPWDEMQSVPGFETGDLPTYVANSSFTMSNAMEWDLPAILASDGIVLLPGWETSTGARWERLVAEALGRDIWLLRIDSDDAADPAPFALVKDYEPTVLTDFLRTFPASLDVHDWEDAADEQTGGAYDNGVKDGAADALRAASPADLVDALHARIGHVPGMAHRIDGIRSSLA